jgi:hypothetical protein
MKKCLLAFLLLLIAFSVWLKLPNQSVSAQALAANTEPGYINPLTATNLEQWKALIPELHKTPGFKISVYWDMEQTDRRTGVPVTLQANGQTIVYKANFADISFKNETNVMEVELHSPIMNIEETRQLGLQLCVMFGFETNDFLAWCDAVGNNWADQPLYGKGNGKYSFQTKQTFNRKRPWYINFMITPNS